MSTQRITRSGGMLSISMVQEAMDIIWPNTILSRLDFVELNADKEYIGNNEFHLVREISVRGKRELGAWFNAQCTIFKDVSVDAIKWQPMSIRICPVEHGGNYEFNFVLCDNPFASEDMFLINPESEKVTF